MRCLPVYTKKLLFACKAHLATTHVHEHDVQVYTSGPSIRLHEDELELVKTMDGIRILYGKSTVSAGQLSKRF